MKICDFHWIELQDSLRLAGLSSFISANEEEVLARMQDELDNGTNAMNFDPLVMASEGITANALNNGGVYLLFPREDGGEFCPLCEMEKHTTTKAVEWINAATQEALDFAVDNHLMSITSQ